MQAHIRQHALGAWVCMAEGQLIANHIPFYLDTTQGPYGCLRGHVARANPVWSLLKSGAPSVLMFMGPAAYISPSWYPSKLTHGKVVPTWNYITVHAHGLAKTFDDTDCLLRLLHHLSDSEESKIGRSWKVSDAPAHFIHQLCKAIVGIEITIDRLEGRLKVSQDETQDDRAATAKALMQSPDPAHQSIAHVIQQSLQNE